MRGGSLSGRVKLIFFWFGVVGMGGGWCGGWGG